MAAAAEAVGAGLGIKTLKPGTFATAARNPFARAALAYLEKRGPELLQEDPVKAAVLAADLIGNGLTAYGSVINQAAALLSSLSAKLGEPEAAARIEAEIDRFRSFTAGMKVGRSGDTGQTTPAPAPATPPPEPAGVFTAGASIYRAAELKNEIAEALAGLQNATANAARVQGAITELLGIDPQAPT